MNGYFQLIHGENVTGLRIFPPTEGGEGVKTGEVIEYLTSHNISYDPPSLNRALTAAISEKKETVLNRETLHMERESYKLTVSPDNMKVAARFYPPSVGGEKMTEEEFLKDLKFKKIVFGIKEDAIRAWFADRRYCTDLIIAQGKEPRHGTDARIEYFFNTDLKAHPELKEDGSVDFFNLNTINHCHKGDVLAKLFPEDPGEYGCSIQGEKIKPREVKRDYLRYGRNIELSEDKQVITSQVDGHVELVDNKVFVSDILEVENVDNSTGNIDYDGSVQINGNVCTNFSVKARGNIEIHGVVEGAYLEAGGDITIARGMNGMGRGTLKADGNIVSKFLENTSATSGGYVSAESILHSKVMAGTEVMVTGKHGFITGGRVSATNAITAKTLGTAMGADTVVEVGADPHMKQRVQQLQKELAEADKAIKSIEPIINNVKEKLAKGAKLAPEQVKYMQSLLLADKQKNQEIEEKTGEMNSLMKVLNDSVSAQVIVTGTVHPGTKIAIADVSMVVKKSMQYCRFIKSGGEVKMTAI